MGYSEEDVIEMAAYANADLRRQKERRLWVAIAVLYFLFITAKYGIDVARSGRIALNDILELVSSNILSIFFLIYAPGLFYQIFNLYPIEFLRIAIRTKSWPVDIANSASSPAPASAEQSGSALNDYISQQKALVRESYLIAEKIYSRAGAYLFLGCSIAFVGVAVFNTFLVNKADVGIIEARFDTNAFNAMSQLNSRGDTLTRPVVNALRTAIISKILDKGPTGAKDDYLSFGTKVFDYLPRFGALLLIEIVAFFFLKQYRVMLEEYRYYESIKRKRQDALVALMAIAENGDSEDVLKSIINLYNHTDHHKLTRDETTQIIESQKIISQELDLFSKITELIKSIKSK
jgi:hypothetical protein